MVSREIVLVPRDGLFCKDGRGWYTSSTGRGHALEWPHPSTVLGALRSLWGRARERRQGVRFTPSDWPRQTADLRLGTCLTLRRPWGQDWSRTHRLWPAPADALIAEGGSVLPLQPRAPQVQTMGIDDDPVREQLWTACCPRHKPLRGRPWWDEQTFVNWLCGTSPGTLQDLALVRRIQTHVAMCSSSGTARDKYLYSHDLIETIEQDWQWGIGCRLCVDDVGNVDVATLGGDRRLAAVEITDASIFAAPESLNDAFARSCKGLRIIVVTPAAFARGWLPDGFEQVEGAYRGRLPGIDAELVLRAAFVNRPITVSGWDMAKSQAKPSTRMVPPGSVFAFERYDGGDFTRAHARALWLATIGDRQDQGFGTIVPGTWNPSATQRS